MFDRCAFGSSADESIRAGHGESERGFMSRACSAIALSRRGWERFRGRGRVVARRDRRRQGRARKYFGFAQTTRPEDTTRPMEFQGYRNGTSQRVPAQVSMSASRSCVRRSASSSEFSTASSTVSTETSPFAVLVVQPTSPLSYLHRPVTSTRTVSPRVRPIATRTQRKAAVCRSVSRR